MIALTHIYPRISSHRYRPKLNSGQVPESKSDEQQSHAEMSSCTGEEEAENCQKCGGDDIVLCRKLIS